MVRTSTRERSFLATQDAWLLAMSGACTGWREVESRLTDEHRALLPIENETFRSRLDEVCARAAEALRAPVTVSAAPGDTEGLIWSIIEAEHRAYWMRDTAFIDLHLRAEHFRMLAWVHSGGMTDRRGFDAFADAWQADLENFPVPNPFCAHLAERTNQTLTVSPDMAWASYDMVYPVSDLPGFNGLGTAHEVRILERRGDAWRISYRCTIDDQFGQNSAPIWQVDASSRVISVNPAAAELVKHSPAVAVRGGTLRLKGADNDARLKAAVQSAAEVGHGIYSRYRARSVILEPDDGFPSQAVWIVNQGSKVRVSLSDQSTFRERLETATSAFGLSPAQCRLAARIADGTSLADAARQEGISASTARTHLQRIFEKVGVRTQSGLISALIAAAERAPLD